MCTNLSEQKELELHKLVQVSFDRTLNTWLADYRNLSERLALDLHTVYRFRLFEQSDLDLHKLVRAVRTWLTHNNVHVGLFSNKPDLT